jgi:acyl-CoA reductase-like NAD-dependent aldehyde dehydrogenase
LAARSEEIGEVISQEVGMPLMWSNMIQAGLPTGNFANYVEILSDFDFEEEIGNSLVVKEPVGVVGAITPWNYPLHQIACKVAPALAAGCTVVLKPSEVAPLNAFILAEIIDDVGLPPGVFNLVSGVGPVVGERLAEHPDVDMVSFTGSTRAGKRVAELAAGTVKRVALELGGKSANIILDDADFADVVPKGVFGCYLNSGQTCTAHTRMLVPRDKHDEIVALAKAAAEEVPVGPADSDARLGPLISETQRERVRSYIEKGIEEGAELVTGGIEPPEGLDKGYFVRPTVFANVDPDSTIAQEEIFGPVLSIIPYEDEDDAIRIANGTPYGLAGGVWSGDQERAERVARRMRAGQIDVNGGSYNILAPFGGYKQSGMGRENGRYGLEEFLEVKSMQR